MSEITNRAAYLMGLAEGLKIDEEKPEGKLIMAMIDLLNDMAEELEALDDEYDYDYDYDDEDEDYGSDDEYEFDDDYDFDDDYSFDDEEDDDVYTLVCENCGAEIDFTNDDLDDIASGDFICPECGETVELDFSECDCDGDCDCGCGH